MTIADLRTAGYDVAPAMFEATDDQPTVFFVQGHGAATYVAEDDAEAITALLDAYAAQPVKDLRALAADLGVTVEGDAGSVELANAIVVAQAAGSDGA